MNALKTVQKFFPQVTEVVDALRPVKIEVTPRDSGSHGIKDHETCALAQACKRQLRQDGVIISRTTAYLIKGRRARRFQLPISTSREVISFDRGGGFAPGTYQLSAVAPDRRLGRRQGSNRDRATGSSGKPKQFRHLTANVRTVLGGQKPEDE